MYERCVDVLQINTDAFVSGVSYYYYYYYYYCCCCCCFKLYTCVCIHACTCTYLHVSALQVWKQFDKSVKEEIPTTIEVIDYIICTCIIIIIYMCI